MDIFMGGQLTNNWIRACAYPSFAVQTHPIDISNYIPHPQLPKKEHYTIKKMKDHNK
jgi:hypothetical protein